MTRSYFPLSGHWGLTTLATGQPFFVDDRCRDITPWLLLGGIWETFVDDVLCALVRPGDTFVDVGANVGYYTIKIGGRVGPEGRVFAFEANPEMFAILNENLSVNGVTGRDRAFNVAAGERTGRLRFTSDPHHPGGGSLWLDDEVLHAGLSVQEVPVRPLVSALPYEARIDLVKIDVEGHEPAVLAGMGDLLSRWPDAAVVCEVSVNRWARFGDPSELLTRYAQGRRLFRIFTDGHLEEMKGDTLGAWLDEGFVSYILMLPDTEARLAQIAAFLPQQPVSEADAMPAEAAASAPEAAETTQALAPPPVENAPRRGLLQRAFRSRQA